MSNEFVEELRLTAKDEASGTLGNVSNKLSEYTRRLFDLSGLLGSIGSTLSFGALIKSGIEFNSTMETTRGGIAALILSSNEFRDSQGRLVTGQGAVNAAFTAASSVQSKLVEDAKRTAASYQDLVGAFQTAYGPATAAGVTNLDKLRQVTVGVSQAVTALGLDSRQLSQEIRAIFTGEQGPDNTLNRVLGITKQQLDAVRKSGGDVGDFLLTKLKPFMDAAAQASDNLSVRASNLKDSFQQLAGEVSKPIFDVLKSAVTQASGALGDAKERLMGMGATAARVLQDLLPLAQALVGLGIVAFDAGLKFLEGLGPAVSILTNLANAAAYVIDQLGPLAPMVYLSVRAFASLTAVDALGKTSVAVRVLTAAVETMQTVTLAGAILTFGALAAVIATVVAGLYSLKLAFDLHKETDAARQSYVTFGDTMISNLNRMSAAHPELRKQVELLKVDILKAQTEGGDAVERAAGKFQTAYNKIAKEARNAGDAVVFMAGKKTVDPAQEKALGLLADQYTKLTKSIEDQIRLLRTPAAQRPFEQLRMSATKDIAEIRTKFEDSGEAIRARMTLLTLQLQEEARKVALAYKGIPVEVQVNNEAALASIKRLPEGLVSFTQAATASTKEVRGLFKDLAGDMSRLFEDGFFAIVQGRLSDLGDIFRSFGESIFRTLSSYFSKIASDWILKSQGIGRDERGNFVSTPTGAAPGSVGAYVGAGVSGAGIGGAVGSVSGAPGFSSGAMIGGTVAALGIAAYTAMLTSVVGAAAAGATIGSAVPIIGTIIGAIIGGLIGVLTAPNTESKLFVGRQGTVSNTQVGGQIQGTVESLQGYGTALADAAGLDSSGRREFIQAINKTLIDYVKNMDFEVHAGSNEDIQKDLQQLISGVIPSEMLHRLFGNARSGGQDLAGISGASQYMHSISDPNAPIPKFLASLGFSVQTMEALSARIDTMDPKAFTQFLGNLVGVVVGAEDLSKKLRATTWGEFQDVISQRTADARPFKQFETAAQWIKDLGAEMNLYTGEERIRKQQELNQLGGQYYESMVSYMASLKNLADGINKSVTDQVKGLQYGVLDDGGKTSFLNKEIQDLYLKLQNENDPTKVATLVQQIQQDIGLLSGLGGNAKNQIFVDWATQLLNSVNAFAQAAISREGGNVAALNDKYGLGPFFAGLKTDLTHWTDQFGETITDPKRHPIRGLDDFGARAADAAVTTERLGVKSGEAAASLENTTGWLDYFAARLSAAADRADAAFAGAGGGGGSGAIETLRRNPYAAARRTGR